jgi:FkbH-like protein
LVLTEEDAARADGYRHNHLRHKLQQQSPDLSDYLMRVLTRITVREAAARDIARVAQLLGKTNQFNLTTRRHDLAAVQVMSRDADTCLLVGEIADRFGEFGLTALIIARRENGSARIENLVLSCRVLGREAEFAFVSAAVALLAERWPLTMLDTTFVPSGKNAQTADFWQRCGLTLAHEDADGTRHYRSDDLAHLIKHNARPFITIETLLHEPKTAERDS